MIHCFICHERRVAYFTKSTAFNDLTDAGCKLILAAITVDCVKGRQLHKIAESEVFEHIIYRPVDKDGLIAIAHSWKLDDYIVLGKPE
ncbi:hypothetical protein, partial [Vibrio harveyi]